MPELIAKSALTGQAPLTLAATTLAEAAPGPITSIAPFAGQDKAVAKALKSLGLVFPKPNRFSAKGPATLAWTSRDQAFLIGVPVPADLTGAALADQTGGWVSLTLQGPNAAAALMRLVPLDLRAAAFGVGSCVRAPLNHMSMVLLRTGPDAFLILTFRSMARTAWHEIESALKTLAARAALA